MVEKLSQVANVVEELISARLLKNSNPKIMDKYKLFYSDMDETKIDTEELTTLMNEYFNIPISNKEIVSVTPEVCNRFNLPYEEIYHSSPDGKNRSLQYEFSLLRNVDF